MRADYCPVANEPCQCMCVADGDGECRLRRKAQTTPPPRLTDEMLRDCLRECPADAIEPMRTRWLYAKDFARAIETAVRKQFGVEE